MQPRKTGRSGENDVTYLPFGLVIQIKTFMNAVLAELFREGKEKPDRFDSAAALDLRTNGAVRHDKYLSTVG